MAIYARRNQYRGVNAHLQSFFQHQPGWGSFHTTYITSLGFALNATLPPGYVVDVEQSLQVREFHPDFGSRVTHPRPDITIFQNQPSQSQTQPHAVTPTLTQPLPATIALADEDYYAALVIYLVQDDAVLGRPVTRVELLSPTNKSGSGLLQYLEKRAATLHSGLNLVEIDLLHETPPVVVGLPVYPAPDAYPYSITLNTPFPSFETGIAQTYGFRVDAPIPTLAIPLAGAETVGVDFDGVYQQTFGNLAAYSLRVDYEQYPLNFASYAPTDQQCIQARMSAVQQAIAQGVDLNSTFAE